MLIEKYDVEIDADGDGSDTTGKVTISGKEHTLSIVANGRNFDVTIDGELCSPEIGEEFEEWTDPVDDIEEILASEVTESDCEDYSARVVNGKVVRLIVRDGRSLRVLRGTLTDSV